MTIDRVEVSKRLLDLRKSCGITRETISLTSGFSEKTIRNWEFGETKIRYRNLEKYLKALESLGCSSSIDWIFYGNSKPPTIVRSAESRSFMDIMKVLEILKATSDLFYYLDESGHILYINHERLHYLNPMLGTEYDINWCQDNIKLGIELSSLCTEEVYQICHEHHLKCLNGHSTSFTYSIGNKSSKNKTEITILCLPVTINKRDKNTKSNKIIGSFGFLSSKTGAVGIKSIKG